MLLDFDDVQHELSSRGVEKLLLIGLCSGADDAIYIAEHRPTVAGLVLLDGYAAKTSRYYFNRYVHKIFQLGVWIRALQRISRRLFSSFGGGEIARIMDVRNWLSKAEMLAAYHHILGAKCSYTCNLYAWR